MARKLRIDAPGAWHHVMNRGARKQPIVRNDHDRKTFLRIVAAAVEIGDQQIHGYCLLGNHYHLVVHTPSGGLADLLQFISKTYTQWFNKKYGYDGALFRGRYHSVLIADEAQLLATSRYVHRNALDAGEPICDYRWSSMPAFIGRTKPPHWLHVDTTLAIVGGPLAYRRFVEEPLRNEPAAA